MRPQQLSYFTVKSTAKYTTKPEKELFQIEPRKADTRMCDEYAMTTLRTYLQFPATQDHNIYPTFMQRGIRRERFRKIQVYAREFLLKFLSSFQ